MDSIDSLLQEVLEHDAADWSAALERTCAARPEHAAELRRRFAVLDRSGLSASRSTPEEDAFPERLGEFRLQRRLGGGGMGVVFLAEQERLQRRVAVKVMRHDQLFVATGRARFEREAEAIAKLSHPGIVPVHTVGVEGGVPFLAMEWIDGVGADRVLTALLGSDPTKLRGSDIARIVCDSVGAPAPVQAPPMLLGDWVTVAARIGAHLARALAHAHAREVLHRDVKPSNFMLTPAGRVVLIDFGLAAKAGATQLTRPGTQLGSLPYMAPEQLNAESPADQRVDVYALGVTLYEMLTLTRPFDRPSAAEIMRAVLNVEADDPRRYNRAVSADLAAVILMAIAKEPARRYSSASALADDLEAVLARRPVVARHATTRERVLRWMQREPMRALAAALAVLLVLTAVAVGAYYVASRPFTELGRRQRLDAEIESALADAYVRVLAGEHSERILPALERARSLDPQRADVVASIGLALLRQGKAEDALRSLEAPLGNSPSLGRVRRQALQQLGRNGEADAVARELLAPGDPRTHHFELFLEAEFLFWFGRYRGDEAVLRRALEHFWDAIARAPRARLLYVARAAIVAGELRDAPQVARAVVALEAQWPDEPSAWLSMALALLEVEPARALALFDRLTQQQSSLLSVSNRGVALHRLGRTEEALAAFRAALAATPVPDAHVNLGNALAAVGQREAAIAEFRAALATAPEHGKALYNLGIALRDEGRLEDCVEILRKLLAVSPGHVEGRNNLAAVLMGLARLDEAAAELREVIALRPTLPQGHSNLRRVLLRQQKWTEYEAEMRRWLVLRPDDVQAWRNLAVVHLDERVPREQRSAAEAVFAARRAVELSHRRDARALYALGEALVAHGQAASGEAVLVETLAVAERSEPRDEKLVAQVQEQLAELRARVGK